MYSASATLQKLPKEDLRKIAKKIVNEAYKGIAGVKIDEIAKDVIREYKGDEKTKEALYSLLSFVAIESLKKEGKIRPATKKEYEKFLKEYLKEGEPTEFYDRPFKPFLRKQDNEIYVAKEDLKLPEYLQNVIILVPKGINVEGEGNYTLLFEDGKVEGKVRIPIFRDTLTGDYVDKKLEEFKGKKKAEKYVIKLLKKLSKEGEETSKIKKYVVVGAIACTVGMGLLTDVFWNLDWVISTGDFGIYFPFPGLWGVPASKAGGVGSWVNINYYLGEIAYFLGLIGGLLIGYSLGSLKLKNHCTGANEAIDTAEKFEKQLLELGKKYKNEKH